MNCAFVAALLDTMPKKPLPEFVAPMMASVGKKPFNDPDWIFETKLDGFRALRAAADDVPRVARR